MTGKGRIGHKKSEKEVLRIGQEKQHRYWNHERGYNGERSQI
jgi:hypothetical protein